LIPLLERCTRTLLAEGDIWAQDFRYVRIWIQYSRLIDRKTEVFDFLLAREVGTDWSALYEEWAVVLEGLGRSVQTNVQLDRVCRPELTTYDTALFYML
jgi:checkpoint serine/threonine-protein kinase